MRNLSVIAAKERIDDVLSIVAEEIEEHECKRKAVLQVNMAVEEIFLNICSYAYGEKKGDVELSVDMDDDGILTMVFIDGGIPFNPLEKEDPDIHIPIRERLPGGLGIFMVKKTMDELQYEYLSNKNILTVKKSMR